MRKLIIYISVVIFVLGIIGFSVKQEYQIQHSKLELSQIKYSINKELSSQIQNEDEVLIENTFSNFCEFVTDKNGTILLDVDFRYTVTNKQGETVESIIHFKKGDNINTLFIEDSE